MSWFEAILMRAQGNERGDERARLGRAGEHEAARFLKRKGYRIVTRNYRCSAGEIDLVALDGGMVVFVEVKTRTDCEHADPQDAVTPEKQHRLMRAARNFILQTQSQGRDFRFDIVAVVWPTAGPVRVEHFVNAFSPARRS